MPLAMRTTFHVVLNTINQLAMHQVLTRVSRPPAIPVDKQGRGITSPCSTPLGRSQRNLLKPVDVTRHAHLGMRANHKSPGNDPSRASGMRRYFCIDACRNLTFSARGTR